MSKITREFIERIPKTDLHLHLDGSLRLSTLIELAKQEKIELPSYTEEGLKELVFKEKYKDLPDYLQGFGLTCSVLKNAENLERVAYELAMDNIAENVIYIEARFAPQQHFVNGKFSVQDSVRAVNKGMKRAQDERNNSEAVKSGKELPFHYGIINCAMRFCNRFFSDYYANLFDSLEATPARRVVGIASQELARITVKLAHEEGLPVVGFDLAGAEAGWPAIDHKKAYDIAHYNFIKKTVHAGEAFGAESIFQAITECHADRIGHGTHLFNVDKITDERILNGEHGDPESYIKRLVDYIACRRITLEVCPTSNLQTLPEIKSIAEHPLKKMLENKLSVSICTDNRLVSRTTPTDELQRVVENIDVDNKTFKNIITAGFKGSFYPGTYLEKRALVRQVMNRYEAIEKEFFG